MSRKFTPQGRQGRKILLRKIQVECVEEGCTRKLWVNRGNAAKGCRCEEHRKIRLRIYQRNRQRQNRTPTDYDPATDSRLVELRSFKVLVKCRNECCDTLIEVDGLTARLPRGVYCEPCRREAKQITDRNYYANKGRARRQKREAVAQEAA